MNNVSTRLDGKDPDGGGSLKLYLVFRTPIYSIFTENVTLTFPLFKNRRDLEGSAGPD